jgi:ferredoxin
VVTEKGEALLGDLILEEMEGTLPSPPSSIRAKVPILEAEAWPQHFAHAFWARLADRCLSCRLCTYVCPTCRCFDVRDDQARPGSEGIFNAEPQSRRDTPEDGGLSRESQRGEGETIQRLRAWDSCMAEGYRRIAGGHNPRPTKTERLRNRFYCKFCYYPRDFGPVACVGCGRCIQNCPVNVDIAEVLERVSTW